MKRIFATMLVFSACIFGLAVHHAHAAKHMAVGYHEVTISGEPYEEQVFLNGGLTYDNADGDRALNIKEQFEVDGGDTLVFFLETLSGGVACPADVPLHLGRVRWAGFNYGQFRYMQ